MDSLSTLSKRFINNTLGYSHNQSHPVVIPESNVTY